MGLMFSGNIDADHINDTIDIAKHDGSTKGLQLGGTLVTATAAEVNILDGVTSTAAELNILDGVTSTAAELNILDGVTSTAAELNILDGVTATAAEINTLDISAVGAQVKVQSLALTAGTHGVGTEVDTGLNLPAKAVVLDVYVDVTTAEVTATTKTVDIGTLTVSNDPDGFAVGLSVAATGIQRPQSAVTVGLNESFHATNTRGALLSDFAAGSDVATDTGLYREKPDVTSSADDISITAAEAFTEFAGKLYVVYMELV